MSVETETATEAAFASWAVLELMGHRRLAGYVTEQQIAGASFLRIDIPASGGVPAATQFYGPQAVYGITPCTEETALRAARIGRVEPVSRWELPSAPKGDEDAWDGEA